MRNYFVSRHPAAVAWAARRGLRCVPLDHLDPEILQPGDAVIGTLPVNLAAEVCRRGARYVHLSLAVPREARGKELTADEMDRYRATLEEFKVVAVKESEGEFSDEGC